MIVITHSAVVCGCVGLARYRSTTYRFKTELDGLNSNHLSRDTPLDDMPDLGQSGRIEAADGLDFVTNQPLVWVLIILHCADWMAF